MDEKKRDSASNLSQALKKVNAIEIYYAKIICMTSGSTRLKIYRKIASLMSNRFSLMNALDMLHATITNDGKNPSEPLAIAIAQWGYGLQNGMSFSDALKGWAPDRERLMLSVGDVSDLEGALYNLIRVTEGTTKMIRPIISAISYPAFLMMMVVLIIYGIGLHGAADDRRGTEHALAGNGQNPGRTVQLDSGILGRRLFDFAGHHARNLSDDRHLDRTDAGNCRPPAAMVAVQDLRRHYLAFGHVGAGQGRNAGIERHARFA